MIESNFKRSLERKIDLYVNNMLNEEQVDELWAELIQDEYYLEYTKSVTNIKAIIERERIGEIPAPVYRFREIANYGVAAAIAIIIGVIGVMNYNTTSGDIGVFAPIDEIELGIVRGPSDAPSVNDNETIKEAIRLATNGDLEAATLLLENELNIVESAELIAELSLTLGSIQYNFGEYDNSLISFQRVVNQIGASDTIIEKGYWYLGNTYLVKNMNEDARDAFQKVYDFDLEHSRIAKGHLDALRSVE